MTVAQVDWGTAPAWVSAIGSSGALLATAWILARDRQLRRRAQAQLVVPIVEDVSVSSGKGTYETLRIKVSNRSNAPVFGVRVQVLKPGSTVRRRYREEGDPPDKLDGRVIGTLPALEDSTVLDFDGLPAGSFGFEHIWHGFVPIRISFSDASGQRWVRWPRGELRRARTSPLEVQTRK